MNNFAEIEHYPLRVYNRAVMSFNIFEDAGRAKLEEYLAQFTKEEKEDMAKLIALTKKLGNKRVKEMVTLGLIFSDDDYKEGDNDRY